MKPYSDSIYDCKRFATASLQLFAAIWDLKFYKGQMGYRKQFECHVQIKKKLDFITYGKDNGCPLPPPKYNTLCYEPAVNKKRKLRSDLNFKITSKG